MRKDVLLVALIAFLALTAFGVPDKPKAKAPGLAMAELYVVGSNVWAKWTVAATPSDSLTVDVSATGQTGAHKMYTADSKTDSVSYPKPAPGASITVSLLATNWRGAKSAAAPLVSSTYVEPDTVVILQAALVIACSGGACDTASVTIAAPPPSVAGVPFGPSQMYAGCSLPDPRPFTLVKAGVTASNIGCTLVLARHDGIKTLVHPVAGPTPTT
jgi:hypothetical protein